MFKQDGHPVCNESCLSVCLAARLVKFDQQDFFKEGGGGGSKTKQLRKQTSKEKERNG